MLKTIGEVVGKVLGNEQDGPKPAPSSAKNDVIVVMMVKDEAHCIEDTIERLGPWVSGFVIVDTGSTDGTQEKVNAAFCKLGLDHLSYLQEMPWQGYAKTRNAALEFARECLLVSELRTDGEPYLLVVDAGEKWEFTGPFPSLTDEAYKVNVVMSGTLFKQFRLFKASVPFRYEGERHETPTPGRAHTAGYLTNVTVHERGKDADPIAVIARYAEDAEVFGRLIAENPADERSWFYLAQSYRDSVQMDKAVAAYEMRARMGGFDEEIYWSLVQVGRLKNLPLGRPLDEVRPILVGAFNLRPWRAEALYTLGWICRQEGRWGEAEMYQRQAAATPMPVKDELFVEVAIYEYLAKFELSINCYWTGKFLECDRLSTELLADPRVPEHHKPQIAENLRLAQVKIAAGY